MTFISCYEFDDINFIDTPLFSNIGILSARCPDQQTIICAHYHYRNALHQALLSHYQLSVMPAIQTINDWVYQHLNCEPLSYFIAFQLLQSTFEHHHTTTHCPFLLQPSITRQLLDFFLFLYHNDYTFNAKKQLLHSHLSTLESELTPLYHTFIALLSAANNSGSLSNILDTFEQRRSHLKSFLSDHTFVFIGFTNFFKKDRCLLQRLIPLSSQSSFYIEKNSEAYHWVDQQFNTLHHIPSPKTSAPTHTHSKYSFDSIDSECRWIIKDLFNHAKQGASIQIVLPSNPAYKKMFLLLFTEFNLSYYDSSLAQFKHTSLFDCIQTLLHFILSPYHVTSIEQLLTAPHLLKFCVDSAPIYFDIDLILRCLRKDNITHGASQIRQSLLRHIASYEETISRYPDDNHQDNQQRISDIQEQIRALDALFSRIHIIQNTHVTSDWIHLFLELLTSFYVPDSLKALDTSETLMNAFLTALPLFMDALTQTAPKRVDSRHITTALITYLEQLNLDLSKEPQPTVYLSSLQESAWFISDVTYVVGFNDTCWPLPTKQNLFINAISSNAFITSVDNSYSYQLGLFKQLLSRPCTLTTPSMFNDNPTTVSQFELDVPSNRIKHQSSPTNACLLSSYEYLCRPISELNDSSCDIQWIHLKHHSLSHCSENNLQNTFIKASLTTFFSTFTFSATSLDCYQACPYQFYLRYVLGYEPFEPITEGVEADIWGLLIHDMMYEFNIKNQGVTFQKDTLLQCAKSIFNQYADTSFFWSLKSQLLFGTDHEDGLIDCIISALQQTSYLLRPHKFESAFNFSLGTTDYQIKGKVDACFFDSDNNPVIVDYKTSKLLSTSADFEHFRSLQLPIYGLSLFKQHQQIPSGSLFFQMHSPDHTELKVIACTKDAKKDVFELGRKRPYLYTSAYFKQLESHLVSLIELLTTGFFSTAAHPTIKNTYQKRSQHCRFCDYKLHCSYKERFDATY